MPVAVLAAGLVAIALAFAAISAVLLIRTLVVSPVRSAAAAAAEVAVVGGVIAWVLTQLANIIEIGLGGMAYLSRVGEQQASDWWNYLVSQTVGAQFWSEIAAIHTYMFVWPTLSNVVNNWFGLQSFVLRSLAPTVNATQVQVNSLQGFVYGEESQTINAINQDLVGLHRWIDGYELPLIRGIGNDLAGLREWTQSQSGLQGEIANVQAQAQAYARALALPIAAAVEGIENSPCMKACEPLGNLGQFIQGIEDAGMLAILIALIHEAQTDPAAVATAIDETIGAVGRDVLRSLSLGIPS